MSNSFDVVVVGAGITGSSVAYFLKKKGVERVLLVERGATPASTNTGKSAAIVRTFYTLPLLTRLAKAAVEMFVRLEDELGASGGFHQTGFVQLVPPEWGGRYRRHRRPATGGRDRHPLRRSRRMGAALSLAGTGRPPFHLV